MAWLMLTALILVIGSGAALVTTGKTGACEAQTGGTCFWSGCDTAFRGNATCAVDWNHWHGCLCKKPSACAHSDGKCYAAPEAALEGNWSRKLRTESGLMISIGMIPLMRSGLQAAISSTLLMNRMTTVLPPEGCKMHFSFEHTKWLDLARDNMPENALWGAGRITGAIWVSVVKAIGLHLMQVILFWLPYLAYVNFMGPIQKLLASIVLAKETWYAFLVFLGSVVNPSFLLFAPFSEEDKVKTLQYFLDPDIFIAQCIVRQSITVLAEASFLSIVTVFMSGAAGVSAWTAIWVGLWGHGAMFPSLLLGYCIAGLAPLVFPLVFVAGRLRRKLSAFYRFSDWPTWCFTAGVFLMVVMVLLFATQWILKGIVVFAIMAIVFTLVFMIRRSI